MYKHITFQEIKENEEIIFTCNNPIETKVILITLRKESSMQELFTL